MRFSKKMIVKYLKDNYIYNAVDEIVIDSYVWNVKKLEALEKELQKTDDLIEDVSADGHGVFQNSVKYNQRNRLLNEIFNLAKMLGISPLHRKNVLENIKKENNKDGFVL